MDGQIGFSVVRYNASITNSLILLRLGGAARAKRVYSSNLYCTGNRILLHIRVYLKGVIA